MLLDATTSYLFSRPYCNPSQGVTALLASLLKHRSMHAYGAAPVGTQRQHVPEMLLNMIYVGCDCMLHDAAITDCFSSLRLLSGCDSIACWQE